MDVFFVTPNDPILRKVAQKIPRRKINSQEVKSIIEVMLKKAVLNRVSKKPFLVGLAAPQIGIPKRIILVDVKATGKRRIKGDLQVFINPEIIWKSKKTKEWYEGCFSTGRVCGIVSRPTSIKIKGIILRFERNQPQGFEAKYTGYVARIFQHEIDHLDGKLFMDKILNPDHLHWVKKSEFSLYRSKEAWRNWPKKCSFEKWQKIKGMV